MSEEQAFLDAIRASPFDDTPRLVYADWLDEHGEPAKAVYLRLVVGLVPRLAGEDPDPAATERLLKDATLLPLDWRMAAAARFMVVLYGCGKDSSFETIRCVRELTGMGVIDTVEFVEYSPRRFPLRTIPEVALDIRSWLLSKADCKVGVHPCDVPELPRMAGYSVAAKLGDINDSWPREYSLETTLQSPEAELAFHDFLTRALGNDMEAAIGLRHYNATLAIGVRPSELERRMQELRSLLPPADPNRSWEIKLHSYYQLSPPPR